MSLLQVQCKCMQMHQMCLNTCLNKCLNKMVNTLLNRLVDRSLSMSLSDSLSDKIYRTAIGVVSSRDRPAIFKSGEIAIIKVAMLIA